MEKLEKLILITLYMVALTFCMTGIAGAVQYIKSPPLEEVIKTPIGDVKRGTVTRVPLITWGGDEATILANGNARKTVRESIFGKKRLETWILSERMISKNR